MQSLSIAGLAGRCGGAVRAITVGRPARKNNRMLVMANDKAGISKSGRHDIGVEQHIATAQPLGLLAKADNATAAMVGAVTVAAVAGTAAVVSFNRGSRKYEDGANTVGNEYDAWTEEGVLEYYWGEHIHLGYYSDEERREGYKKKNFIQAKYDFIDEMLKWSGAESPKSILDVGCGIGGTSRYLAKKFPDAKVIGITISENQVRRATQLAEDQGIENVEFRLVNALDMSFEDNTFDLVWACESGEHMPDKKLYVQEMARVLKPGGNLAVATWCQKDAEKFNEQEKKTLQFLYDEWAHPYFVSKEEYARIMGGLGSLESIQSENWVAETINSWRHSIWVGVWDPWIVVFKGPRVWWKTIREIVTLERMHQAFDSGLMEYGMIKAVKAA